jgi:uroporphyrinogen-III synthase
VTRPVPPGGAGGGTRPDGEGGPSREDRLVRLLRAEGMIPLAHPLLRLEGPPDPAGLAREVDDFLREEPGKRRWLVLTSANAVPPFLDALRAVGGAPRWSAARGDPGFAAPGKPEAAPRSTLSVAAVGPATAEALGRAGLPVDLVPERFTGDDLLDALLEREGGDLVGVDILFPRAERARETLPGGLAEGGARVRIPVAYRTLPDEASGRRLVKAVRAGEVDVVTLTSGSAAEVLGGALRARERRDAGGASGGAEGVPLPWPSRVRIAVIGPLTARAARERGLEVHLEPPESTLPALVREIARLRE